MTSRFVGITVYSNSLESHKREALTMVYAISISMLFFAVAGAIGQELPRLQPPFRGQVRNSYQDSKPDFPKILRAPQGAPNIVLILLDDVGYSQTSTFGGSISTPNLDKLAKNGLRYTQFHTTGLCSPTRAALLTGRNHHAVSSGSIVEQSTGFDGYTSVLPRTAVTVAEILRLNGYSTAAFGKWHNTPVWETSAAGPFDHWPTGLGFEYFYGFLGGDTNQWEPALFQNTRAVQRPSNQPNYHLTTDLADRSIAWVREHKSVAPDKPYFLYLATGAAHAPHQVRQEWIDRYKGKFDHGWDRERELTFERQKQLGVIAANTQLTKRPAQLQAWNSLSADERRLYARMEEVYAGFLSQADFEVGRVLDAIGQFDDVGNTMILYVVGDNGASAEGGPAGSLNEFLIFNGEPSDAVTNLKRIDQLGGPMTFNHYPAAWAWAGDTPFQWMKQVASHFGGTRNPLVVSWPGRISDRNGIRTQFHHVIDIAPTILEAARIEQPRIVNGVAQQLMDGVAMSYTYDRSAAPVPSRRTRQYFEMVGNRAIYDDGWVAASMRRVPWLGTPLTPDLDSATWELYHVADDYSEARDLADSLPAKLREMRDLFTAEAVRNHVLPIDDRAAIRFDASLRPSLNGTRKSFSLYPGTVRIPENTAPDLKNRSYQITAEAEIPAQGAQGILVTQGGRFGGYAFFLQEGRLHFVYNYLDRDRYHIESEEQVPAGAVSLRFEFNYDGGGIGKGGRGSLFVNGKKAGEGRIEKTVRFRLSFDETFDVGEDTGTPVLESYQPPFRFTGKLNRVQIDLR